MKLWRAFADDKLLGATFDPSESWSAHLALFKVLEGDTAALTPTERDRVAACTARETFEPARESLILAHRRAGKGRGIAAPTAVGLAVLREWPHLAPGEVGRVLILAPSQAQAKSLRGMCGGIVDGSPLIRAKVRNETASAIDFGRTRLEVMSANARTLRGYSCCAVICDEIAHWYDDETSSNPASEVIRAVRPTLASMPDSMLLATTTPWARTGTAWEWYRDFYGKPGDVLVWHAPYAPSTRMNSTPWLAAEVAREEQRDPVNARTEYGCEFRTDIESFLSREQLEPCIRAGGALPARAGVQYFAAADSSGGVADSYTLGIGHREMRDGRPLCVVDRVEERRAPFDPRGVTRDFAALARAYNVHTVHGDRYSASWTSGAWEAEGFRYVPSELTASELFRALVPALLAGDVELPGDDERLIGQLVALERRATRGGREQITHPPNGHDDLAVAAAGVVQLVLGRSPGATPEMLYGSRGYYAQPRSNVDAERWRDRPRGILS